MTAATDEKETNPQSRHRGRRHRIPTRPSDHPDHPETPQAEQQEMDRGNRLRHHRPRPRTRPTSPTPDVASRAAGIQTSLQWVRDVTYGKGHSRTRTRNAPQIMVSIRKPRHQPQSETQRCHQHRRSAQTSRQNHHQPQQTGPDQLKPQQEPRMPGPRPQGSRQYMTRRCSNYQQWR